MPHVAEGDPAQAEFRAPAGDRTHGPDDDASIIGASRGDPERFAEIYDRHAAGVHRFVARRLGGDGADDVTAETFLAAFRARGRYDLERPEARPWLFGIATREISRRRRREGARLRMLARSGPDEETAGHEDAVATGVTAQSVRRPLADQKA